MMNRFFVFIIFVSCLTHLKAAEVIDTSEIEQPIKSWRLGITPTSLLNVFPGIQFSGEYQIKSRFSVGTEAAYIFANARAQDLFSAHDRVLDPQFRQPNTTHGYRFRPYAKFKFWDRPDNEISIILFYNLRFVRSNIETSVFRGDGSFFEIIRGQRTYDYRGLGLMIEDTTFFGGFGFNFGLGVGPGYVTVRNSNDDLGQLDDGYNLLFSSPPGDNRYLIPIALMHINIFLEK